MESEERDASFRCLPEAVRQTLSANPDHHTAGHSAMRLTDKFYKRKNTSPAAGSFLVFQPV
jgi:hypothetical protein